MKDKFEYNPLFMKYFECCKGASKKVEFLNTVILKKHASKQHEKSYRKFEETVMHYRSTGYQFFLLMHMLVVYSIDKANYTISAQILKEG